VIERQLRQLSTTTRDDRDVSIVPALDFQSQKLSVWRPARPAGQFAVISQLPWLAAGHRYGCHIHDSIFGKVERNLPSVG